MKIFQTLVLVFISFNLYSQEVKLDSVNYISEDVTISENGKRVIKRDSNLFVIFNGRIKTTIDDQRGLFYRLSEWEHKKVNGSPMSVAQYADKGGFICTLAIGYDKEGDKNFIIINYSDITFFYECNEAQIKPQEFLYGYEAPDYTNEEVDEFLSQFGDPEILKNLMIMELLKQ